VHLEFYRDFPRSDVPALLQAMGIANTLASFVFASTLTRVSTSKQRQTAGAAIMLSWIAMVVVGITYAVNITLFAYSTIVVDIGLALWFISFIIISFVVAAIARTTVNRGLRSRKLEPFENTFNRADFGVPIVDDAIRRARTFGLKIYYPFLLVHDHDGPGIPIIARFIAAGIDAKDAVIYFTFSRPASIIVQQFQHRLPGFESIASQNIYIIDCYSMYYMPEQQRDSKFETGTSGHIFYADPLNPADVYSKYAAALEKARKTASTCRAVYETLSEFVRIADFDLAQHYLRRTVVYEEMNRIKALYVFWAGALTSNLDETYLHWFFDTTIRIESHAPRVGRLNKFTVTIERLFPDEVQIQSDDAMTAAQNSHFVKQHDRIIAFGNALRNLKYRARPYGFLAPLREASGWERHVANLCFFMVAIDYNTHSETVKYEGFVNGHFYHGSDLLYKLAEAAKLRDAGLFLAERMADMSDLTVANIFRSDEGIEPADIKGRTAILNESAKFLIDRYDGDVRALVDASDGAIAADQGLFARLRQTSAYEDPVGKKANLLCKLLVREGLYDPKDRENLEVSVDHIVMTMALRSGIISCANKTIQSQLEQGIRLDEYTISVLRDAAQSAMSDVVAASGYYADEIDDLIWSYGRESLREATPLRDASVVHSELDAAIDSTAQAAFIAFMNGIDSEAEPAPRMVQTIRFPFTRYY
jgi:Potential Queuosine, Q, salvage protein family